MPFERSISKDWRSEHHLSSLNTKFTSQINAFLRYKQLLLESWLSGDSIHNDDTALRSGKLELVKLCHFPSLDHTQCRGRFHHVPTSLGLCSTFNSLPFGTLFREDLLEPGYLSSLAGVFSLNVDTAPVPIPDIRPLLRVMVDVSNSALDRADGHLVLAIESQLDVFDMTSGALDIGPGLFHKISVKPK